jgi:hypothetical protein
MNEMKGRPMLQKALAFAVFLKFKLGRSSMMRNYSINKIHTLTGISATTINKYMPVLIENGWVRFDGKNQQHLIVCKLASHADNRNICIDKFCYDSYKDVYRSLRAFLALIIQSHKDFIKRTIQIATDPQKGQNCKAARKLVKRLVRQGILRDVYSTYKEYGLSLKRIAKETGNCVRTAYNTMKYAISKGWTEKQHHFEQVFAPKIHYMCIDGYTFATRNNLYKVYANTYELNKGVASDISHGNISL